MSSVNTNALEGVLTNLQEMFLRGDDMSDHAFTFRWDNKLSRKENLLWADEQLKALRYLVLAGIVKIQVKDNFVKNQQEEGWFLHGKDFSVWSDWDRFDQGTKNMDYLVYINGLEPTKLHEEKKRRLEARYGGSSRDNKDTASVLARVVLSGNKFRVEFDGKVVLERILKPDLTPYRILHYLDNQEEGSVFTLASLKSIDTLGLASVTSITESLRTLNLPKPLKEAIFPIYEAKRVKLIKKLNLSHDVAEVITRNMS